MPHPINLAVNAEFVRPFGDALACHGLDASTNPDGCVEYLQSRTGLPEAEAQRIVAALRELGELS